MIEGQSSRNPIKWIKQKQAHKIYLKTQGPIDLLNAVRLGNFPKAEELLQSGVNVNQDATLPEIGIPVKPLHLAAAMGNKLIIELLLNHPQIELNALSTKENTTALQVAAFSGKVESLKLIADKLHEKGLTDIKTMLDFDAIYFGLIGGHFDIVNIIIDYHEKGIPVFNLLKETSAHFIALHFAIANLNIIRRLKNTVRLNINYSCSNLSKSKNENYLIQLIPNITNARELNYPSLSGFTPLHMYSWSAPHYESALLLIELGASLDIISNYMGTPLHIMAGNNNCALFDKLKETFTPAQINRINKEKETPLDVAMKYNRKDMALRLIKLRVATFSVKQVMEWAMKNDHQEIWQFLIDQYPERINLWLVSDKGITTLAVSNYLDEVLAKKKMGALKLEDSLPVAAGVPALVFSSASGRKTSIASNAIAKAILDDESDEPGETIPVAAYAS